MNKKPEVLAPCGDFEALKAAISAQADAVYISGKMFGARSYAKNFTDEELIEAIKLCHLYNIKVYVTVNTIIFEKEIPEAIRYIDFLYQNDVDAVIIQDIGLASIINHRYPNLDMHASTQMNAQTVDDVKVLKKLGFSRVILGREVPIEVIKEIKEKVDIEIEVFVHGALCISYSGNCYFSLLNGGRSGNRGKCAQPCRMLHKFRGSEKYYLSPKDLCTLEYLDEITPLVRSLKIEGRMKSKEYVYYAVKAYKEVFTKKHIDYQKLLWPLKVCFNRGFTKGFILGETNEKITNVGSSNHLGVSIGKIKENAKTFKDPLVQCIKLSSSLKFGDAIRIINSNRIDVVNVNQMYVNGSLVKEAKANDEVYLPLHKKMQTGDEVFITKREEEFTLPKIEIFGKGYIENDYFVFEVFDSHNKVKKKIKYEKTEKDLQERIKEQLLKTGNTPYIFSRIDLDCKNVYIQVKDLNELRRNILDELTLKKQTIHSNRHINKKNCILDIPERNDSVFSKYSVVLDEYDEKISLKNCDIYHRNYNNNDNYYLPRVCTNKPKELSNWVSSNLGSLGKASSVYMNVVNSYAVRVIESLGVQKVGLSFELSFENMYDLIKGYKKRYGTIPRLEVMIYGHIQMMYMKHCFINKDFKLSHMKCNMCHKGFLLDDKYPLYGDENCHLAILSEKPLNLCAKEDIDKLEEIGISNFVIDLIGKFHETCEFYEIEDISELLNRFMTEKNKYRGCF